jgi:hypothetical protein
MRLTAERSQHETLRVHHVFTADLARPRPRANRMNRRNFITVFFSGTAAAWPLARAQKNFLLCPALAQDEPILGARSSGLNVNKLTHFQIWRTITLGTYSGVDTYRRALDSAGIKIGNAADEILGRPAFPYTGMKTDVELALLSAANLGVESESSLSDLYKRAKQVGLELCPAEVALQLRLDYRNQPLGEALNIAMEPVATHMALRVRSTDPRTSGGHGR